MPRHRPLVGEAGDIVPSSSVYVRMHVCVYVCNTAVAVAARDLAAGNPCTSSNLLCI